MDKIKMLSNRRILGIDTGFKRYLYNQINWDNRLIILKGAKGVGKTTLILQHIKESFSDLSRVVYVNLDHIWFTTHTLLDFVEYFAARGVTHFFFDEVHKLHNWQVQIKNVYDYYPEIYLVVTVSSLLKLQEGTADLSRRQREYTLLGMSLREFLELEGVASLPVLDFEDVLHRHETIAAQLTANIKIIPWMELYMDHGYYPFYREDGDGFGERLLKVVDETINVDMPAVSDLQYESIYKLKQLLSLISEGTPFTVDIRNIGQMLGSQRNTILKMFDLLEKGAIVRRLYAKMHGLSMLTKPEKILFDNPNLICAFSDGDKGSMRETFFVSQVSSRYGVSMPKKGDFLVGDQWLFEIGGPSKGFSQIKDIENSYVVSDNIENGGFNRVPLWLFGLLY